MAQTAEVTRRQEMKRALRWSALFFVGFLIVTQQVLSRGYLYRLDHQIKALRHHTFRGMSSHLLLAIDDLGLRGFTATVLLVSAAIIGWRFKSFRPFNLSVLSLLFLNGVVGLCKLIIGRTKPRLSIDQLHSGGLSFPSGHASNALLTWGLLAYLIYRYTQREPFHGIRLNWLALLITFAVSVVSLIRDTHWFSDLLGGAFLGASLLVLIIAIDRSIPSAKQPS
ncbi:MAG: phosphatase PAP2 family protein [Actinomycetes bacterium]